MGCENLIVYLRQATQCDKKFRNRYFYEWTPKLCLSYKEIVFILWFVSGKRNLALVQWLEVVNRNQELDGDSFLSEHYWF